MTKLTKPVLVTREEREPDVPKIGEWYWVREKSWDDRKKTVKVLRCVTHIGSNYVELTSAGGSDLRVHADQFHAITAREPDAPRLIKGYIEEHRQATYRLMDEARQITARLGVTQSALTDGSADTETQALTTTVGTGPIKDYKASLVKAKTELLPKIFEQIGKHNEQMATWMKAELIPLRAEADKLKPSIEAIETRIFNVELYAGLVEEIVQIRDGQPAKPTDKVHLFQRRAYMDEECLIDYRGGGMEFRNLEDFDAWMARPENSSRLLPHPRSILAFRVRRTTKERDFPTLSAWVSFLFSRTEDADKLTYLYMRNGEQLFRLRTGVEFTEELFPDLDVRQLDGVLYAEMWNEEKVERLLTEGEYLELKRLYEAEEAKLAREREEWQTLSEEEKRKRGSPSLSYNRYDREFSHSVRYDPDTVSFDDITKYVQAQIAQHNRVALLLQGLFDRSPVFQPHPVWHVWTPGGFEQAVELVYDKSRVLVPTEKPPDFEEYRTRLNALIRVGTHTIGQEDYWEELEAEKENAKHRYSERYYSVKRYRPYGDPGPGYIAKVAVCTKTKCTYRWEKEPSWRTVEKRRGEWLRNDVNAPVPRSVTAPKDRLFNVDAYTPGDFHLFFDDPRTRADYLQWAPYLLAAEDWHAGWTYRGNKRVRRAGV